MARPRQVPTAIVDTYILESSPEEDERGSVGELLRRNWVPSVEFVQWNVVQSVAGALRGVHWHERHHDLIAPVAGASSSRRMWRPQRPQPTRATRGRIASDTAKPY